MKKLLYILFAAVTFVGCGTKKIENQDSVLNLVQHSFVIGGENQFEWCSKKWWVLPSEFDTKYEYMMMNGTEQDFKYVFDKICEELGDPEMTKDDFRDDYTDNCKYATTFLYKPFQVTESKYCYWWFPGKWSVRVTFMEAVEDIIPCNIVIVLDDIERIQEKCIEEEQGY